MLIQCDVMRSLSLYFRCLDVDLRVRSQKADKPIVYTIHTFAKSAATQTFELKKEKKIITVKQFFKDVYQVDLQYACLSTQDDVKMICNVHFRYPNLPTLETTSRAFMPMELVDVEPARCKKITEEQRAKICRYASMKPAEYHRSIQQIRHNPSQQNFTDDPFVQAWKMNVDPDAIVLKARVKPMPTIVYTDQYQVTPDRVRTPGVWEATASRFHQPNPFPDQWGLINLSQLSDRECYDFYNELRNMAHQRGMNCPQPGYHGLDSRYGSIDKIMNELRVLKDENGYEFLLVILPRDTVTQNRAYISLKKLVSRSSTYDEEIHRRVLI